MAEIIRLDIEQGIAELRGENGTSYTFHDKDLHGAEAIPECHPDARVDIPDDVTALVDALEQRGEFNMVLTWEGDKLLDQYIDEQAGCRGLMVSNEHTKGGGRSV